jgi:S-adenosylmethionine:tRNA ribosyltransferase-isomerase
MKELDAYTYTLPPELIAQTPTHPRDHARLLVYKLSDGTLTDSHFYDLPTFLSPQTTLVLNNSKVEQCRWLFDDGKTELFVVEKTDTNTVRAMVRPGKKFRKLSSVDLTDWFRVEVLEIDDEGIRTLKLNVPHDDPRIKAYEHVPLPPYIKQDDGLSSEYQTVFAKPLGSLAAPTAGLHFTEDLLHRINRRFSIAEVTLHVGLGTFAKLSDENLRTGRLHSEAYYIDENTAKKLNAATHRTAVGTTSLRSLESAMSTSKTFSSGMNHTELFIRPGYTFMATDSLITNFHLPSTSLLMLVAAFIADKKHLSESDAIQELMRIYQHAVQNKYRFYSFGDAMMIM